MNKNIITQSACCMCLATTAVINNFAPLLFVTFENSYGVTRENLAALIALNFITQVAAALLLPKFIDKLGYKRASAAALICVIAGLFGLAFLPDILPPFAGLFAAIALYALGSGILNITLNPVINQCVKEQSSRSLLYSSYCWGYVCIVLFSTLFFHTFGTENWRILACLWSMVPLADLILFLLAPIQPNTMNDIKDSKNSKKTAMPLKLLLSQQIFIIIALAMLCSGASEHSMSQWASMFAEIGLNISKTTGDLAGPLLYAVLMGLSRILYPVIFKITRRITLEIYMFVSGVLCVLGYVLAAFAPISALAFAGCGLCGFSAGIFWPGTISLASKRFPEAGTAMFAVLSLTGNIGGAVGPAIVGMVSERMQSFNLAMFIVALFPFILAISVAYYMREEKIKDE